MLVYIVIGLLGLGLLLLTLFVDDVLEGLIEFDSGFISGTSIGGFAAALGFAGALTLNAGGGTLASVIAGVGAGAVIGGIAGATQRALVKAPVGVVPNMTNVVGLTAVVTAPLGPDTLGQVSVRVGDHVTRPSARCDVPAAVGDEVEVISSVSPTLVVVRPLG